MQWVLPHWHSVMAVMLGAAASNLKAGQPGSRPTFRHLKPHSILLFTPRKVGPVWQKWLEQHNKEKSAVTVACHVIPVSGKLDNVDIPDLSESPWPGSDIFWTSMGLGR